MTNNRAEWHEGPNQIPVKSRIAAQPCAILSSAPGSDRGYVLLVRRFRGGGLGGCSGGWDWRRRRSGSVGRVAEDSPPESAPLFLLLLGRGLGRCSGRRTGRGDGHGRRAVRAHGAQGRVGV